MKDYKLKGRIWLTLDNETVLGEGKIYLLNQIKELGSLRKAAETMKMSYRKAWFSIQQVNRAAKEPIVVLTRGGKEGGSAKLTDYGIQLLEIYKKQQLDFQNFLNSQNMI